jgi:hypothetical protein
MAQKSKTRRKPRTAPASPDGPKADKSAKAGSAAASNGPARRARFRRAPGPGPATRERPPSGRYTPPIPRSVKRSPRWYPWVLLTLLLLGVICIILNYIGVLPKSPTNWYVLGGLISILAGALMATGYH